MSELTLTVQGQSVTFSTPIPVSSGEVNFGANVGAGEGVFRDKIGSVLNFKSITGSNGVIVSGSADEVDIALPDAVYYSSVLFGGGNIPASGTTDRFLNPWFETSNAGTVEIFLEDWPFAANLSQLRSTWGPSSGSVNVDFVLRVNAADTPLAFTALSDAGSGADLVNSAAVAAGDQLSFVVRKSAGTGSAMQDLQVSMRVEAV